MDCSFLQDDVCQVATKLCEDTVKPELAACEACKQECTPMNVNKVTVGLALANMIGRKVSTQDFMRMYGRHLLKELPLRVVSYLEALAEWVLQGLSVRSEAEVKRLYKDVCGRCPYRIPTDQPEVSMCGKCGCTLSDNPSITNKLFIETSHCPIGEF